MSNWWDQMGRDMGFLVRLAVVAMFAIPALLIAVFVLAALLVWKW